MFKFRGFNLPSNRSVDHGASVHQLEPADQRQLFNSIERDYRGPVPRNRNLKAGTKDHKTEFDFCFVVLWEGGEESHNLLGCRRHETQFGHKSRDRTLNVHHCTGGYFLHQFLCSF